MSNDNHEFNADTFDHGNIQQRDLAEEMKKDFLEYSMSVIVARALPDVRDGMKPVHRRILYAMNDMGIVSDKPHRKSARIVGEVIGKYHPHGDSAAYETMVRMAQDFSYRYPLVDPHGNFGSIDGDSAAAMRYTEARMSKIAMQLVRDINKETVDMVDNYDGEEKEPVVLPSRFPNLIVNGSSGIAVGMATNCAPHNLNETIEACIALMENPDMDVMELMQYLKGPDFPTGAYILGRAGIKKAYTTGKGSIVMRAKSDIDELPNGKPRIIITEIPYMVNKANMVEKIAQLVRDKEIDGITDLRDESNMKGIRIVIELRKDVQPEVLLNQLYRKTALQSTFGINNVILVDGVPRLLPMKDIIMGYLEFQNEVIVRRTKFDLAKAEARAHILEGLRIAVDNIDRIIAIIRSSKDPNEAMARLMEEFELDEIQSRAIIDMQLRRLTGLERDKIEAEYQELLVTIADLKDILARPERVKQIITDELNEIKDKFGDERRSEIIDAPADMQDEDLIPEEHVIITLSEGGYIKRIPSDTYRVQNRGGKGIKGMNLNKDDVIDQFISMSTHDHLLVFTSAGLVYRLRGFNIPEYSRTSKGIPVINLLNIDKDERVMALVPYSPEDEAKYLFFATRDGIVKRTSVKEFESIRSNGKIAITLAEGDQLAFVRITNGDAEIILGSDLGKAVRFDEKDVRPTGRTARGVKGFNVDGGHVIGMATSEHGTHLLTISENGYGKKTPIEEYRLTNRGTKGVKAMNVSEKTGNLVCMKAVDGYEDCMIMTDDGIVIRISLNQVSEYSRATQGVKVINTNEDSKVSTVAIMEPEDDEEEVIEGEESTIETNEEVNTEVVENEEE